MTQNYSQTIDVAVPQKVKARQWIGISCILGSLGLLMLAIFLAWYCVFPFVALLAIGIVYLHFYNTAPKEFTYEIGETRLVVAKKDLLGKTKRILTLMLCDITEFALMEGLADDSDVVACGEVSAQGVMQIVYREDEKLHRLLFLPDDYMTSLISERLDGMRKSENIEKTDSSVGNVNDTKVATENE